MAEDTPRDKLNGSLSHTGGTVEGLTEQDVADLLAWLESFAPLEMRSWRASFPAGRAILPFYIRSPIRTATLNHSGHILSGVGNLHGPPRISWRFQVMQQTSERPLLGWWSSSPQWWLRLTSRSA